MCSYTGTGDLFPVEWSEMLRKCAQSRKGFGEVISPPFSLTVLNALADAASRLRSKTADGYRFVGHQQRWQRFLIIKLNDKWLLFGKRVEKREKKTHTSL